MPGQDESGLNVAQSQIDLPLRRVQPAPEAEQEREIPRLLRVLQQKPNRPFFGHPLLRSPLAAVALRGRLHLLEHVSIPFEERPDIVPREFLERALKDLLVL